MIRLRMTSVSVTLRGTGNKSVAKRICQKSTLQKKTSPKASGQKLTIFSSNLAKQKTSFNNREMKIFLIIVSILLILESAEGGLSLRSSGWRGSNQSQNSKSSYLGGSSGNYPGSSRSRAAENSASSGKSAAKTNRGLGISAWGIIGIIIGAILLTTTAYYAVVLYPYVCKKQRTYDMMELTNVV